MSRIAFISGPISAKDPVQEARNLQAFESASNVLRNEPGWSGCTIHIPLTLPGTEAAAAESAAMLAAGEDYTQGPLYKEQIRLNMRRLTEATMVFMLPGWRSSAGARGEAWLALACGIEVRYWVMREPFDARLIVSLTDVGSHG